MTSLPPQPSTEKLQDYHALEHFDALLERTVTSSMIAGGGGGGSQVEPASPEEVATDVQACQQQTIVGPETLPQATLPFRRGGEGGVGLNKQRRLPGSGLLYVGYQVLVLGGVVAGLAGEELAALRQTLQGLPMTAKLVTRGSRNSQS